MPLKAPPPPAPVMNWAGFYSASMEGGGWLRGDQSHLEFFNTASPATRTAKPAGCSVLPAATTGKLVTGSSAPKPTGRWTDINGSSVVVLCGSRRRHGLLHRLIGSPPNGRASASLVAGQYAALVPAARRATEIRAGQVPCATPVAGAHREMRRPHRVGQPTARPWRRGDGRTALGRRKSSGSTPASVHTHSAP